MAASDVFGIVGTTQAGNFRVERVVAEGGFGVVYQALHEGFRAPVALKCLKVPEELTSTQRGLFLEKFREEAELMFRLSAAIPEVCRPLHIDVLHLPDGGFVPFLAMEWLEGESLDAIITRRRKQGKAALSLQKLQKMMRPIAVALSRAHHFPAPHGAIAIIHRDLKPENLFQAKVGGVQTMKILDFGIATARRAASMAAGRLTGVPLSGDDEGASFTPAYGAPEQWSPKTFGPTGPWTDVWGLGLTLVEALSGQPAIDGDSYEMRRMCLDERRRPTPRALGVDVPMEVERVFERALALDPRRRTNDIETFWTELEVCMGLEPSITPRDQRRDTSQYPDSYSMAPHSNRDPDASWSGSNPTAEPDPHYGPPLGHGTDGSEFDLTLARPLSDAPESDTHGEAAYRTRPKVHARQGRAGPGGYVPGAPPKRDAIQAPPAPPSVDPDEMELPAILMAPGPPRSPSPRVEAARVAELAGDELDLSPEPEPEVPQGQQRRKRVVKEPAKAPLKPKEEPKPPEPPPPAKAPEREIEFGIAVPMRGQRPETNVGGESTSSPRPARPVSVYPRGPLAADSRGAAEVASLRDRLRGPVAVLLLALTVALTDTIYAKVTEDQLWVGPVRPLWIASPLALFGVAFTLWRLIGYRDDG